MNRSLHWILLVPLVLTGCHKGNKGVASPPIPAPPASVAAAIPAVLMDAESAFNDGEFLRAANSYDSYLQSIPQSTDIDGILFRYAVSQSLSGIKSLEVRSVETFRKLIHDYPESAFVAPSRMAVALQSDITRLEADNLSRDESIRQLTALLPPPPPVLPPALAEAETSFDAGDFPTAAKFYETYLQSKPQSNEMDRILLRFGVAQSMSGVPAREVASAETFKQLINEYPNSPYSLSARRIVALRNEMVNLQRFELKAKDDKIQKLNDELDKLKKIDSERRRTP